MRYYINGGNIIEEQQVPYEQATDEEKAGWADYRQQHVKRLKELTLAEFEKEIRRQTIDRIYQRILGERIQLPGDTREIFHDEMNSL
jgi:hypothetical protein